MRLPGAHSRGNDPAPVDVVRMTPDLPKRSPRAHATGAVAPLRRGLRRNAWSWLTVLAVAGTLAGIIAVVRTSADRKDVLRQAQTALAAAPGTLASVFNSPQALLSGEAVDPSEFPLSKRLRGELTVEMAGLNRFWPTSLAQHMGLDAALVDARTATLMALLASHNVRAANVIESRDLQPLVAQLSTNLGNASAQLIRQTQEADETAWVATLGVAGVAGLLLVLSLLGLAGARRRREGAESARLLSEIERTMLSENEQRMRALVEHGSDMITVIAPDTTILYQAGAVVTMLGYEPHELEGSKLIEWLDPADRTLLVALCASRRSVTQELRLRHRDGTLRTFETRATSLLDHPAWEGIVLNIWDVSERKELEERLRHQAFHDTLTGLPNRALFADRVEHALARAQRTDDEIAVLLIDLDDFKAINDSLGHATGDQLLVEVAARLDATVRGADTVARLGGDEFAVILEDDRSAASAEQSANRILAALSVPIELDGRSFPIAASVGIARAGALTTAIDIVRDADVAMYMAKGHGKNRHAVFDPSMQLAVQQRLDLKADLLRAVAAGNEFEAYYQPVVTLETGVIVALEALARWNHPTQGVLEPDAFIPLAEELGAIVAIGRSILNQACHEASRWAEDFEQPLSVSVNVSAVQLENADLAEDVRKALQDSGLAPERLVLEITESEVMRDIDRSAQTLASLRELGIRIALDDFGTGYSSLSQLQRLPIDIVKVEQDFAGSLRDPGTHPGLIQAVMDIGKTMSLTTVAERIETPEQLRRLQELNCPLGQGYLFSRPLPADGIRAILTDGHDYAENMCTAKDGPVAV
jgi:diguanylate cyclase (GGDEF)-like protein/PAS domain S-box-containing protein